MMRVLLSLMLLAIVATACPSLADDQPSELKADEAYGVKYAEERVIDLPADQGKWYVTVFGDPTDAKYRSLKGWFDTHPSLKHLKGQTHFHAIATNTTMYRQRYAASTPKLPCVRIQAADSRVMFQVCGRDIPMSADALDQAIRTELFRRRCPQPQPQPQPEPQPKPDPAPQPLDHVGPPDVAPEPKSSLPPWWLLVGLGVLGAGAGVVAKWKETYYPSTKK
jgi:hypothetical protein